MIVAEFIELFRREMLDTAAPYMFSDEEIVSWLNEAVNEACERAKLIEDSTSTEAARVALVAGEAHYDLHPSVLFVKRITINNIPIRETSVEVEDDKDINWESQSGTPRGYIVKGSGNSQALRLVPTPVADGQLNLTVYRLPMTPLSVDLDSETIPLQQNHLQRAKYWTYRCAHLKPDAEVFDRSKADEYEARFEAAFGVRPDANVQRKRRDRRVPVVRMNPVW